MFLHVSVSHSVHRGAGGCLLRGVPGFGGVWSWGGYLVPGPGGAWSRGMPGPRGTLWRPPGMATAVGSTHPTGMHSCSVINSNNSSTC